MHRNRRADRSRDRRVHNAVINTAANFAFFQLGDAVLNLFDPAGLAVAIASSPVNQHSFRGASAGDVDEILRLRGQDSRHARCQVYRLRSAVARLVEGDCDQLKSGEYLVAAIPAVTPLPARGSYRPEDAT